MITFTIYDKRTGAVLRIGSTNQPDASGQISDPDREAALLGVQAAAGQVIDSQTLKPRACTTEEMPLLIGARTPLGTPDEIARLIAVVALLKAKGIDVGPDGDALIASRKSS